MSEILRPYTGDKRYIFISYAHKDMTAVMAILEQMNLHGYRIWFDEGIDPGTEWDENIASHVEACDSFIAFITEGYIASENCKDELNYARDLNKNRLLVYLEDVSLPRGMAMRLNRLQAIFKHKYQQESDFYEKLFAVPMLLCCQGGIPSGKASPLDVKSPVASLSEGDAPDDNDGIVREERERLEREAKAELRKAYEASVQFMTAFPAEQIPEIPAHTFPENHEGKPLSDIEGLKRIAEAGNARAQHELGRHYYEGDDEGGVTQDFSEAVKWYRLAAEQGNSDAQYSLGLCYQGGEGVPQDDSEAAKWFFKAADQGNAVAQRTLSLLYSRGAGLPQDSIEAVKWCRLAATQGDVEAQCMLGDMYRYGYGSIQQDLIEAANWYGKAAIQGFEMAEGALQSMNTGGLPC